MLRDEGLRDADRQTRCGAVLNVSVGMDPGVKISKRRHSIHSQQKNQCRMFPMQHVDPNTKLADLTAGDFETILTRALCRAAEFHAVRAVQEQAISRDTISRMNDFEENFVADRLSFTQEVKEILLPNWPSIKLPPGNSPTHSPAPPAD